MTASLHASRFRDRVARSLSANREPGRVWRWRDGVLSPSGAAVFGDLVAVPTEDVFLASVNLPLPSYRQRVEALPFAIEDHLAEPIAALHVALGAQLSPRRYLAGAVRHDVMRLWFEEIRGAGIERATLVPDALLLPPPPVGSWRVDSSFGRALIRSSDGTGFAMPSERLSTAWNAAGRPALIASGAALPADMAPLATQAAEDEHFPVAPLDLAQGRYAMRQRIAIPTIGRRVLQIAGLGVLAHSAIALADTIVLREIAAQREYETRTLASTVLPGIGPGEDLVSLAASRLPSPAARTSDTFIDLLDRISVALGGAGAITFDALRYEASIKAIELRVNSGDEQSIAMSLRSAGLNVVVRPGQLLVRRGRA